MRLHKILAEAGDDVLQASVLPTAGGLGLTLTGGF